MRILFVAPYIPSAVRVRPFQLIRALAAEGHSVHLVALQPPEDQWAPVEALREMCVGVDVFPMSRARTLFNGLAALPGRLPLQAAYSHQPALEQRLRALAASRAFDVLHVEHLRGAVLAARITRLPRVFDAVDSITLLFEQAARKAPGLGQRAMAMADLGRTRRFEARAPREFDRTVITSPVDREEFIRLAGSDVAQSIVVIPNGVDTSYFRPCPRPSGSPVVLFTGKMSYHANASGALFLAREVMPLVWNACPGATLAIVGKGPSRGLLALAADRRIQVTGFVEDLRPWFAQATVAVAPMLYGVGIQNKVLEAMASGVPVVTTSRTCDSLLAETGRDFLVGDSADEIARQVVRVLEDSDLRTDLARAGRHYVETQHDWRGVARKLVGVYQEACDVWAEGRDTRRMGGE
jgi:polysaccharide biosynthesis protein PslH